MISSDIINKGADTIIIDENGERTSVKLDVKVEAIDNSINGRVKYSYSLDEDDFTYDKFGNKSKSVYKDEYMSDEFRIYVNDDTLFVGEIFNATVWTGKKEYSITVSEPLKQEFDSDQIVNSYRLEYSCSEKGLFSFAGAIKYDSTNAFPFEYKFLVLEKK